MSIHKVNLLGVIGVGFALGFSAFTSAQTLPVVAGCKMSSFIDGSESNQITTAGAAFNPKCLRIKAGASVTIQGTKRHPLAAMPDIDGAINPFATTQPFETPQTRKMDQPGLYGYFCDSHGDAQGNGMAGAILVVP